MTEQELRALVRDAIARHAGVSSPAPGVRPSPAGMVRLHPSHGMFALAAGSDMDGPCIIEPR